MTRETKIGLVVGLFFIIVIGVLLSNHLTTATSPPKPQFADGSGGADRSTTSPGGGVRRGADRETQWENPVEPGSRLRDRANPGPVNPRGNNGNGGNLVPLNPDPRREADPNVGIRPLPGAGREGTGAPVDPPPADQAHGEQITLPPGTALYEAKPNDTVSKLAAKFMGANTNANREKLISLNPSLKANPNKIVVGDVYIVPDPNARGVARTGDRSPLVPLVAPDRTDLRGNTPAPREEVATTSYTTRPGDTLWKIARDQCGSQSKQTVDQIKTLNQDVLKGKEMLHPNLKLKIPARAVATRA